VIYTSGVCSRSVIEENCVGEVELEGGTVWFLHVRRVCGPLLYASYLGTSTHLKGFFYINSSINRSKQKFCKYLSNKVGYSKIISARYKKSIYGTVEVPIYSGVLASHHGFDSRPGHVSLGRMELTLVKSLHNSVAEPEPQP